jgi:hypothetical protein
MHTWSSDWKRVVIIIVINMLSHGPLCSVSAAATTWGLRLRPWPSGQDQFPATRAPAKPQGRPFTVP